MSYADRYSTRPSWLPYLGPLFLLAVGGLLLWWFWPRAPVLWESDATLRPVAARGDLAEEEKATIALFRNSSPSVVHITNVAIRRDFFSMDVQRIRQGTGSGFIWDERGHIVTNNHVIEGADAAIVTLASDSNQWKARLVGAYPEKDIAVLSIDAPKAMLKPILVGTSHDLQVGQRVFAIGNPFGLDQSLTTGIVSALGRELSTQNERTIKDLIQTDAAINPGNSGGPLLDSAGRLIGMNTAIFSPSGASAGIGFAIPVDEINRVVTELIKHGKVVRPDLGAQLVDDEVTRRRRLPGVLILRVAPGRPAARAGLKPTRYAADDRLRLGDIITAIDGQPTTKKNDVLDILEKHAVGDTVTVTVISDGEKRDVKVTLGASS